MRIIPLIIITAFLFGCSSPKYTNPHVVIETRQGDIEIELYPDKAPQSVAAFLSYIKRGYYKNASFYRVLNEDNQPSNAPKAELIQGGTYRSQPALNDTLPGIAHETTQQTGILHKDGTISLARTAPGTATTEFFICIGDQPGFDFGGDNNPDKQGYAAFGKVVRGMDIVKRIYNMPESDQYFSPPVPIYNIEVLD
jgi:peptidyl-prolyl cis-trans isomerase A (cyclophilin A)